MRTDGERWKGDSVCKKLAKAWGRLGLNGRATNKEKEKTKSQGPRMLLVRYFSDLLLCSPRPLFVLARSRGSSSACRGGMGMISLLLLLLDDAMGLE